MRVTFIGFRDYDRVKISDDGRENRVVGKIIYYSYSNPSDKSLHGCLCDSSFLGSSFVTSFSDLADFIGCDMDLEYGKNGNILRFSPAG